jgi:hypothetical protein
MSISHDAKANAGSGNDNTAKTGVSGACGSRASQDLMPLILFRRTPLQRGLCFRSLRSDEYSLNRKELKAAYLTLANWKMSKQTKGEII